jgi:hypothetical protein
MSPVPSVMLLVRPLSSPRGDSIPKTPDLENRTDPAAMRRFWDAVVTTLTILSFVPIALFIFDVGLITLAWPRAFEKSGLKVAR